MCLVLPLESHVVLPRKFDLVVDGEIRFGAAQPPDDLARVLRDFVDGIGMTPGEEKVSVGNLVDRICMAALPSVPWGSRRSGRTYR